MSTAKKKSGGSAIRILLLLHYLFLPAMASAGFECIGTFGGTIANFIARDHYVYLAQGYNLRVLDIADPNHPREVGWQRLSGEIQSMAISGNALYLATPRFSGGAQLDKVGVRILDLADPGHPVLRGSLMEASRILELQVMGTYLLVDCLGKYSTEYSVYDIRDPFQPMEIYSGRHELFDCANGFVTDGTHMATLVCQSSDQHGCHVAVIDVNTSRALAVVQTELGDSPEFHMKNGRLIANSSNTTTSIPLAGWDTEKTTWLYSQGLTINERHQSWTFAKKLWSFVSDSEPGGLWQDEKPLLKLSCCDGLTNVPILLDSAFYSIDSAGKLRAYELSNSTRLHEREIFPDIHDCQRIQLLNHILLVLGSGGLRLYDVKTPLKPHQLGSDVVYRDVDQFLVADRKAYVAGDGLTIVDLAKPEQPKILGQLQASKLDNVRAVEGDIVFMDHGGDNPTELTAVDCTNLAAPRLAGSWQGTIGPMSSQGSRLYIAGGASGLLILDISDPTHIKQIGNFATKAPCTDLATSGTLVYLLAKDLLIVDTSDAGKPRLLSQMKVRPFDPDQDEEEEEDEYGFIRKSGAFVYAGHSATYSYPTYEITTVVDVSNPAAPRQTDWINSNDTSPAKKASPTSTTKPATTQPRLGYLVLPQCEHNSGGTWYGLSICDLYGHELETYEALQKGLRPRLFKDRIYFSDGTGCLVILAPSAP